MSLWLALWPNRDIVIARAEDEEDFRSMLDEAADPGKARIIEYDEGPFCLELKAKLPGKHVSWEGYLRPHGDLPPPDALRKALWEQQQARQLCDATLVAANGEQRAAHRAVLAAACPALGERLQASSQVVLPSAPTGETLEVLLRWLYLQEAKLRNKEGAGGRDVLPLAVELGLDWLAEACDDYISVSPDEPAHLTFAPQANRATQLEGQLEGQLELAAFAHRHGRTRLLRHTLYHLPQGQWGTLRRLAAYAAMPPPLQALVAAGANREPPGVIRGSGFTSYRLPADVYRDAGGQLSADEAAELASYEQARAEAAGAAAGGAGAGAGAAQEEPEFEVLAEELTGNSLFRGEDGQLPLALAEDPPYQAAWEFKDALTRFAFPSIGAEIERQKRMESESDASDGKGNREGPDAEMRTHRRMLAALRRDMRAEEEAEQEGEARRARLQVAAERGDRQAAMMLMMDVSVPGVFPGVL